MQPAINSPPPSTLETEVKRVRALLERSEFAPGLEAARALSVEAPDNRDVLYMIAVSLRYLKRIPEALQALERLERLHPGYPRLYQERGHCHVALRAAEPAIEAYERAVTISPALPASWRALQGLYRMTGRMAEATNADAQVKNLAALPHEIVTAFSMYADGEILDAEQLVRGYLLAHGDHVEGMRLLAKIGLDLDVADDAELLLARVLELAPQHREARHEYAIVLLKRHKHVRAREEMEKLLALDPDNRMYRITHATVCIGFGDYQALVRYRELLAENPGEPELHLSIAHALKTLGATPEAIETYHAAAALRPDFGEAYWSLANLKTYRFTDAEIAHMRRAEASPKIQLADRYHMCFALGKALEDHADYAESFSYYERGNALKKIECRYRPEPLERMARLHESLCTAEFFAARAGWGCDSTAPIFIVGLPRAGSTLIEQILASHSQVEGTMELADIPRMVQDLQGREVIGGEQRYPDVLGSLSQSQLIKLGEKYLADTSVYRTGKARFIDKMPNNFRHLALIHLILPNARIIDARREAMACCFSNFKQLFASGQQFTYSIEDIARYYRMYVEVMAHWDEALSGKVLRVQHETVVDDLEGNVRRILDFCELDFEAACLDFHKTPRTVHSASSEQVRRPIFREGLHQWRHYDPWLGPLRAALGALAAPAGWCGHDA
ncbi:MAG: sulfotransferase [Steroidobacteraceae bacterium]|jgi:tetratricopeptide (TPR) repeat protein